MALFNHPKVGKYGIQHAWSVWVMGKPPGLLKRPWTLPLCQATRNVAGAVAKGGGGTTPPREAN